MKHLKALLYSLIFSYSSLFSLENIIVAQESVVDYTSYTCDIYSTLITGFTSNKSFSPYLAYKDSCESGGGTSNYIRDTHITSECNKVDGFIYLTLFQHGDVECIPLPGCTYDIPPGYNLIQSFSDSSACDAQKDLLFPFPTQAYCMGCQNSNGWDGGLYVPVSYTDPESDTDGDGLPNKCDPDSFYYNTFDCDGNGVENSKDDDIDGDGILNEDDNNPYSNDGTQNGSSDECNSLTLNSNERFSSFSPDFILGYREDFPSGYLEVIELIPQCNKIRVLMVTCPKGYVFDSPTQKCKNIPNSEPSDNKCSSEYLKKGSLIDMNRIGYFPDLFEHGAEYGKCYYKYSCSSDWRIYKLVEVSCSSETDPEPIELDISSDSNSSSVVDSSNDINLTDSNLLSNSLLNSIAKDASNISDINSRGFSDVVDAISKIGNNSVSLNSSSFTKELDGKDDNGDDIKVDGLDSDFSNFQNAFNMVSDGFINIQSSYDNMKSRIDEGFINTNIKVSNVNAPSGLVLGTEITFDICPFLSMVSNIFYYIFSLIFLILSIRLYWLGFNISYKAS